MSLSEIRVNTTKTRTGVGTITYTETGPVITGIATASNFKTGSTNVHSTGVELANINTGGSTATFGGPISGTTASFSGTVSIGGTLTYEDVTNIDSVGLITARAGIKVKGGNLEIGDSNLGRFDSSGIIKTAHGTESSPSHTFINDPDNGMYRPTTNTLGFVCGGDEKLRIKSDGVVNIGDRADNTWIDSTLKVRKDQNAVTKIAVRNENQGSSASSAIAVNAYGNSWMFDCGSAAKNSNALTIRVDATSNSNQGTEKLRITSAGKIGINEDNPDEILHINSGTSNGCLKLESTDSQADLYIVDSGGQVAISANGDNLLFQNTGSQTERLRITAAGKLIISTNTTTTAEFDYAGVYFTSDNSTVAEGLFINNIGSGTGGNASISFSGDSGNRKKSAISHVRTGNYGRGDLTFSIDPDADSGHLDVTAHEKLRITSVGNIGINENNPQRSLHIGSGGTIRFERGDGTRYGELWNDNSFVELKASTDPIRLNAQSYIRFDIASNERSRIDQYAELTLDSGSQGSNSKPGIELKSTGYTGNITRLYQDSPGASSVLETTERSLVIDVDSQNQVSGSHMQIHIHGTEEFRFDSGHFEFKEASNTSKATLLGGINYYSNTNLYVDLTQWTLGTDWNHLEVFGYVNPNSAGSGQYTDPVHMYVYRGIGWANGGIKHFIYSVHVAPPARQAFPGGSGMSGNSGISAVWCNSGSVVGNESATSTHYVRLVIPNANASYGFQKSFRILRRF